MPTLTHARPNDDVMKWLERHAMKGEVLEHRETFTAMSTARSQGADVRSFVKVVAVQVDDRRPALIVVEAPDRVDLAKARRRLGARDVRLMSEAEMLALAPDCDPGALPAIGGLLGIATYADYAVQEHGTIAFEAGNHRCSVRVDRGAWERSAGVKYGDFIAEEAGQWAPV